MTRYWCHVCNREVNSTLNGDRDLVCVTCGSPFVEELEGDAPPPVEVKAPTPAPPEMGAGGMQWHSIGGGGGAGPMQFMYFGDMGGAGGSGFPPPFFRPFQFPQQQQQQQPQQQPQQQQQQQQQQAQFRAFPNVFTHFFGQPNPQQQQPMGNWQGLLEQLFAGGGGMGGMMGGPGFANMGDYRGANIQDVLAQLMAQDPNRHGPPPATEQSVDQLKEVKLTQAEIDDLKKEDKLTECAVCKEEFTPEDVLKRMPCGHQFHPDCLVPWLKMHNTCPVCRYALPTDDPNYERRRQHEEQQRRTSTSSSSSTTAPHTFATPSTATTAATRTTTTTTTAVTTANTTSTTSNNNNNNNTTPPSSTSSSSSSSSPRPISTAELEAMPNPWAGL